MEHFGPRHVVGYMSTRRSLKTIAATALAVTAAACALSAAGPTATASADNWNHRSDYLRFPSPVNYTRCTSRRIRLDGNYRWTVFYQHWAHPDDQRYRDRYLQLHGVYRWLDCLHYYRSSPGTISYYKHRSWIRNEATGGEALWQQDVYEYGVDHLGDGSYDWGSLLHHL
jgi:hypothetical protein